MATVTPSHYASSSGVTKVLYNYFTLGNNSVTRVVLANKSDPSFTSVRGAIKEVSLKLSKGIDEFFVVRGHIHYKKQADVYLEEGVTYGDFTFSDAVLEVLNFTADQVNQPAVDVEHTAQELRLVVTLPDLGVASLGAYELIVI